MTRGETGIGDAGCGARGPGNHLPQGQRYLKAVARAAFDAGADYGAYQDGAIWTGPAPHKTFDEWFANEAYKVEVERE